MDEYPFINYKKKIKPFPEYKLRKWKPSEKKLVIQLKEEKGLGPKSIAKETGFPIDQIRFWLYGSRTKRRSKKSMKHNENSRKSYYRVKYNDWYEWKANVLLSTLKARGETIETKQNLKDWIISVPKICEYCKASLDVENFSVDHKQPLSRNGENNLINLVQCCNSCNMAKGALTYQEYRELLDLMSKWEPKSGTSVLARLKRGNKFFS